MSLLFFTLKEEHLKLLTHLNWRIDAINGLALVSLQKTNEDEPQSTIFGSDSPYDGVNLILNGKVKEIQIDDLGVNDYTPEQIQEWDTLLQELPTALSIILQLKTFTLGKYKCKAHEQVWKYLGE